MGDLMAKFVLEKSLTKDAPEGYHYVRQALGFTAECEKCGTSARVMSFFRCSEKGADPKNPLTEYEGGMATLCSVECYRKTLDYASENALNSHNDRIMAAERAGLT
ncbi:MAG: hypothetical protein NVSMB19_26400 [Vulcanimicrobiaceae bacterium]